MHPVRRFITWWVQRVVVEGDSMLPTLRSGDEVLAVRRWRRPRVGDLDLCPDPRDMARTLVKRCHEITGDQVVLRGDNPEYSTDSRHFGPVPRATIRYFVVPLHRH